MTSATIGPETDAPSRRRFKMKLRRTEFIVDDRNGLEGRFPAGAVLTVDEDTAVRWLDRYIADPAPKDAVTFQEERRLEAMRKLETYGFDEDDEPSPDRDMRPEDRQLAMRRMPRRRPRSLLADAEVTSGDVVESVADVLPPTRPGAGRRRDDDA